jgi:hypothetical protein
MNKFIKRFAPYVLLCLLFACSCGKSPLGQYGESFEQVMRSDSGLFRGINFGMSKEAIKALEPTGLKEEDSNDGVDYLFYELALDSTTSYTVAYYCPNNRLNNIEADIYLLNEPQAAELFTSFKNYFEKKYGKAETDGDFFLWTAETKLGKARIALADESPTYKRGKLTLVIHDARD